LCLFLIVSCQFFQQKKALNERDLLQQRLKEINWTTVDKLPSVASCDSITGKNEHKKCFFEFFTNTIKQKINTDSLSQLYPNKSFLLIKVSVFPNKPLKFQSIIKDSLTVNKVKIDSLLTVKLVDFPVVSPALKQGIPVKTQFAIRLDL
jgi:hypothetical protein